MKHLCWIFFLLFGSTFVVAQGTKNDIPVSKLPSEVKDVLIQYIEILRNAKNIEECAEKFTTIAGGSLVNEDAENITLRQDVPRYSLKKDFENIKFYDESVKITRVNVSNTNGTGYGASALKGKVYKIWIQKKKGANGLPAPISIIIPEGHTIIQIPKVVGIGSL